MPRHSGIEVRSIPDGDAPESGFLAVWVERSERRPHRSELGDKYYYRRAGTSSRVMEHFEIEDAFKRMAVPQLSIGFSHYRGGQAATSGNEMTIDICIRVKLSNEAAISAAYPYVIADGLSLMVEGFNSPNGISTRSEGKSRIYEGDESCVIHPGTLRTMATLKFKITTYRSVENRYYVPRKDVMPRSFHFQFWCLNSRIQTEICEVSTEEILSLLGGNVDVR